MENIVSFIQNEIKHKSMNDRELRELLAQVADAIEQRDRNIQVAVDALKKMESDHTESRYGCVSGFDIDIAMEALVAATKIQD